MPQQAANPETETIHQSLGFWSSLLARTMEAEFNRRLAGSEVTRVAWAVLGAITYDNITTPSDLADFLRLDRAAVTRLLDKLETQGLIIRQRNSQDRRAISLQVTARGRSLAAELLQVSRDVNAHFTNGLSPQEATQYIQIVTKMMANGNKPVGTL